MKNIDLIIKKVIKEATGDSSSSRGSYILPMQPGFRPFEVSALAPFTQAVSKYESPLLAVDSYDGSLDEKLSQIKKLESTAKKISNFIKRHPYSTFSDDDGNLINPSFRDKYVNVDIKEKLAPYTEKIPFNEWVEVTNNLIQETSTTVTAGEYSGPQELGLKKWTKEELGPFTNEVDNIINYDYKKKTTKNNVSKVVGGWEKRNGKFDAPSEKVNSFKEKRVKSNGENISGLEAWYNNFIKTSKTKNPDIIRKSQVNEDLAVWFGKKKKPKGSSQPKGPWVDICRKVDGKHPPCGRHDTSKGSYPKCRAAGVAGKMSDSQKKSACQQKRNAEKKDTQTGKGQKPIMTSYKPKKKTNENLQNKDQIISRVIHNFKNK